MNISKFCKDCGLEFIPSSPKRIFCSDECYAEDKRVNAALKRKDKREKQLEDGKPCKICKKPFKAEYSNSQYCYKCRPIYQKHKSNKPIEMMNCELCDTEIVKTSHNLRFCKKCLALRKKKQIKNGTLKIAKENAVIKAENISKGRKPIDEKWLRPRGSKRNGRNGR